MLCSTPLHTSQRRSCFGVRMSKHGHSTAIHCSTDASVSSHNGCIVATRLRVRHSPTRGARRVASRGCSVRGACRGVGLAFARPAFCLVLRPRTRWPPCVAEVEHLTASMFANSSRHMKGAETSSFLGFVVVLADRWKHSFFRRGHVVERWCGTGQRDRLMPPTAVGPPSWNAGAAVLSHCTTSGPHGPLPCAPSAEVSRVSALFARVRFPRQPVVVHDVRGRVPEPTARHDRSWCT